MPTHPQEEDHNQGTNHQNTQNTHQQKLLFQGNLRYVVPRLLSEKGCVLWGSFFHGASMLIMGGAVNVRSAFLIITI